MTTPPKPARRRPTSLLSSATMRVTPITSRMSPRTGSGQCGRHVATAPPRQATCGAQRFSDAGKGAIALALELTDIGGRESEEP
jgi:hypothetical protein